MVFTSGTQIKIPCLLLSTAGAPVTGATVLYTTYNPSNSVLDSALTCTEIGIGLYEATTTPNAVGTWKIEFTCAAQNFYDAKGYYVGAGLEATIVTNTTKPAADATANSVFADVIGDKTDAAQQTVGTTRSLMAYVKALLTNYTTTRAGYLDNLSAGAVATAASITTIDPYFDVPTADSSANVLMRDVVGNKSDAQVSTVGTTASLAAYIKGMLTLWTSTKAGYLDAAISSRGTSTLATSDLTAQDAVSTADSTGVTDIQDVIGNKSDTANQTIGTTSSLMRYVKALLTNLTSTRAGYLDNLSAGAMATAASITTIDAYFDVPAADAVTNAQERDVVGNKTDAQVSTVGTTVSLMAYVKGMLTLWTSTRAGYLDAAITGRQASWGAVAGTKTNIDNTITAVTMPAADSTGVAVMADVIGNKSDAAQQTVGTTRSIMAYVKALLTNYTTTRAGYLDNLSAGAVATAASITTIDPYFDVPTADSSTNALMRDAVGNKADAQTLTVGTTTSLMAYMKGLATNWTTTRAGYLDAAITGRQASWGAVAGTKTNIDNTITAVTMPSADSTGVAVMADVIGNKSDTVNQTVGTTSSIMRYVKALLTNLTSTRAGYLDNLSAGAVATASALTTVDGYFDVPTADAATNTVERDVVGNKTDAAVTTVGTTKSIMAYVKGLTNSVAGLGGAELYSGTFTTSSATVPADTGLAAYATNYWNGCIIVPQTGTVAKQARLIDTFTTTTGVFTLDIAFTAVPGLVAYKIYAF